MPLLIAHRGLIDGYNEELENHPDTFKLARRLGYDIEVDVRYHSGNWFLGHDSAQYEISFDWLQSIDRSDSNDQHHAWIHAKDIETLYQLRKLPWEGHIFFHQNDDVVLTSSGYLWTFPGKSLTPMSICVMPEWTDAILKCKDLEVHAYCSDFINELVERLK